MGWATAGTAYTLYNDDCRSTKSVVIQDNKIGCIWIRQSDDALCSSVVDFAGNDVSVVNSQVPLVAGDKWVDEGSVLAICRIDTNWIVVTYESPANNYIYLNLYEITGGNSFTYRGTTNTGLAADHVAIVCIETNKFILAYRRASNTAGYVRCGTRSGNGLTLGSAVVTTSLNPIYPSICKVDEDKFVLVYKRLSDNRSYCICGTTPSGINTAGRVITVGTQALVDLGIVRETAITSPATNKVVIFYDDQTAGHGCLRVGTVSGTTITVSSNEVSIQNSGHAYNPVCTSFAGVANCFAYAYQDAGDSNSGKLNIAYINFSTGNILLNFGTATTTPEVKFSTNAIGGTTDRALSIVAIDSNTAALFYNDTDSLNIGKIRAFGIEFYFRCVIIDTVSINPDFYEEAILNTDINNRVITGDLMHYSKTDKKRFVLGFRNATATQKNALKTVYDNHLAFYFYRNIEDCVLTAQVMWVGDFNFHTPVEQSRQFTDLIYQGTIILEQI